MDLISYATVTPANNSRTNSIVGFSSHRLDYKKKVKKRRKKTTVWKRRADPITGWGQVQICLTRKTNKRDNEAFLEV